MSEAQSRPARGRSTTRGGRGGHGSRGPRPNKQTNGDASSSSIDTSADQGELGELKRRYLEKLNTLKEIYPDWTDVDLLLAIEESDGDLQGTIERISEGNVSQFAEVKKTKDRSRSKVKDVNPAGADAGSAAPRGGRGRGGHESTRGGRGRGSDRGRGGFRGARGGATNGARSTAVTSIPTVESSAWETPASTEVKEDGNAPTWDKPAAAPAAEPATTAGPAAPAVPQSGAKKTWASMFAKPKPAPAPPKPVTQPSAPKEEPAQAPAETAAHEVASEQAVESEELPVPPVADEVAEPSQGTAEHTSESTPEKPRQDAADTDLAPSRDELTKDNVDHLPDVSHPPLTDTAASTVASSRDIGSVGVATPLSRHNQVPIGRPGLGGFATTALKATAQPRSASFQKKLMEQQEAVVMPGNHAVDRAAVQFGSLGLNGEPDADALDVDEDREEAETRTQPPQHSPVTQPRAALPPAPRQAPTAELPAQEAYPTPKQAPGLPPVPQQQQSSPGQIGSQVAQNPAAQANQQYNQFGRYGQGGLPSEPSAPSQKPYDAFGHQTAQSNYDYPNQQQNQSQAQQQPQSQQAAFSSAPDSFASQYFTADQQRNAYQNYYHNYNQQNAQSQQEAGANQQRTGSGFGSGPSDSTFPSSQPQQNRYNEAQNSGHNTPNPALGHHPSGPGSQTQHMHPTHGQPGHTGGYPYNHPYYGSPYYANYMNQFGNYGQGGYGGFGAGKGMYGQPHHYGVSPQTSFDQHSSSPANAGGFGGSSLHGRDSAIGAGLGDYNRSVSQTSQNQHSATAGAGFGGLPDMYGRSQAGYPNPNSSYSQQQGAQPAVNEDALKPFGETKSGGGPSPSALGQPGRPGSATNNTPGQSGQGGLPPPQSHQQGFGGYPSHLNQGNYGGLGGLGHQGAGSHQSGGFGGGYGGFGGAGGYSGYNRGGWGTNYGGQH